MNLRIRRLLLSAGLAAVASASGLVAGLNSGPGPRGAETRVAADAVEAPVRLPFPDPLAADPYEAAQLGIDWLVDALCTWQQTTAVSPDCVAIAEQPCFGCHVQAETILGLARSANRCYELPFTSCSEPGDESPIQFAARFVAGVQRKDCILGPFGIGCQAAGQPQIDPTTVDGQPAELGSIGHYAPCGSNSPPASVHPIIQSAHGGLNLAGYTRHVSPLYSANLVDLADWFLRKQQPTGQWIPDRFEAPVDQGESFCTGSATFVMREARNFVGPAQAAAYDAAMAQARAWSGAAAHVTTQDISFGLLTLLEAGAGPSDADLSALRDVLLAQQLPDGGWAERPGLQSNAYATGQALNALFESGLTVDEAPMCSGVGWLVDNQNLDGSWNIGTAGVNTDSTRNENFPATIWPVLALGNLRPFGATAAASSSFRLTCEDYVVFPVLVTHAADTACGLFARDDSYELSVSNAQGDLVSVAPTTLVLGGGESAVVTVTWQRVGPRPPAGSGSVNTLRIESIGARDAGCPTVTESVLSVVVPFDEAPEAVPTGLRVARRGDDLALAWQPLLAETGPHEIVVLHRGERGDLLNRATRLVLDPSPAELRVDRFETRALLDGHARPGGPALSFYKVRATSACTQLIGPTCNFDCADPERCDASCL